MLNKLRFSTSGKHMDICIEIPCNWRDINNLCANKTFPSLQKIESLSEPICEKIESVLLPIHERDINVIDLRNWVNEQIGSKVSMFNRFSYIKHHYRVEMIFIGTNFRFHDAQDACLFKLFWW